MTEYQSLLDQSAAFLEEADPETVVIVGCTLPIPAEIGQFRRYRDMERTGDNWVETGPVVLRWAVLRKFKVTTPPESGQNITVRGKTYRIRSTLPDTTTITLDCVLRA